MKYETNLMVKISSYTSKATYQKLKTIARVEKLPMSRIIGFLIDQALSDIDKDFSLNLKLPEDEFEDYAYADEASKILNYVTKLTHGAGLDLLVILRGDMGIEDKFAFLAGFKECLDKNLISPVTPPRRRDGLQYPEGYRYYAVSGTGKRLTRSIRKKSQEYEQYCKLKEKFEREGE